jgi:peptidoglycan/xylan/chitin deacetylase (PgdA/CDA1 family)
VKKVMSASPAASYGIRTMLYGTLLPAPDIGTRKDAVLRMREAAAAGHECGVHAWDHVDWHDRLPRMERSEVFGTFGRAAERFAEIFGRAAEVAGAPGWTANGLSVEAYEASGIRIASDTRGGSPFRPLRADGTPSSLVEVPSTLPTLDELLAFEEFRGERRDGTIDHLRRAVREARGVSVHSVHTEIEGGRAFAGLFARQLEGWSADGVSFVTLADVAESAGTLPARPLRFTTVCGRAIPVTTGEPAA